MIPTRTLLALALLAPACSSPARAQEPEAAVDVRTGAAAAEQARGLTPLQMAKLRYVSSAAMSPDAAHVAYTLGVPREPGVDDDGGAWTELHVVDTATGRSRGFVTGEVNVSGVRWTPDGSGISFLTKRGDDEATSLYVIPIDGGEARRAVGLSQSISDYSWNADGTAVALVAREPEDKELEKLRKKGYRQEIYEEDYRHRRLYVATPFEDADELEPLPVEGSVYDVVWSPVDGRLAIVTAPTPLVDDSYMAKTIHVVSSEDGSVLASFDKRGKLGQVTWSPDGRRLGIVAAADMNDPTAGRLMVAPAGGGTFAEVLPGWEGDARDLEWQGADSVMLLGSEGVTSVFYEVAIPSGDVKPILRAAETDLASFDFSADGQHAAFVASSPTHPTEVFGMSHGEAAPERWTDSNPWLADVDLARQEVVRYTARDGLELEGILVRPLDEPAGPVPLVLVVHGGPESHYRNGWMSRYANPAQTLAARGFATFFPNYRGSTGRGLAFAKLSQGDPAGKEFDDCVDAVDHLIAAGLVDRDRVGVTGGSYGGYATAWMSTYYSERFAAGVMFVGISDKVSKWGTTDIPEEEYHVHARHRVWDDVEGQDGWQFFLERSPIYHADRNRTALLILHGKEDPRVDPGQSRELYRHVKTRGSAPVRLVYYPGEGHGNRRAAARHDYCLRMLRWMEAFLVEGATEAPDWRLDYSEGVAEEPDAVPMTPTSDGGR